MVIGHGTTNGQLARQGAWRLDTRRLIRASSGTDNTLCQNTTHNPGGNMLSALLLDSGMAAC